MNIDDNKKEVRKNALWHENFPLASKYDSDWIIENSMGPNVLWLTEWLCNIMNIKPGMKVLDMGCGKAISSVFLSKEFGVNVWATDLWVKSTDNWKRICKSGYQNQIFPMTTDARALPYAEEFFDSIVCVDSYIYFGTDDFYLNYFYKFVRPGCQIGIVVPGLMKDFNGPIPEHLVDFWGQDCWCWHTVDWWRYLWERTGLVDIEIADTMPDGCNLYLQWKNAQDKAGKNPFPNDIKVLKEDAGEYIGFIRMVARRRE